ncbi:MAG: hypothetical protein LKM34_07740 [Prevotella sp.]|nr:hypothetical protein [Prevotella sp.]
MKQDVRCHLATQSKFCSKGQTIDASDEYAGAKDLNEFLCKRKDGNS